MGKVGYRKFCEFELVCTLIIGDNPERGIAGSVRVGVRVPLLVLPSEMERHLALYPNSQVRVVWRRVKRHEGGKVGDGADAVSGVRAIAAPAANNSQGVKING